MLVNKFYSGILVHAKEYESPIRFRYDVLYTYFDGQERVIIESDLAKLLECDHYGYLYEAPNHNPSDNVWDTLAKEVGCKKIASNLKSLPLQFLHHFIASTVQCRTRSFNKVTTDDIWLLEMASKGTKINLARFIMNKMLKILKDKEKKAKGKQKSALHPQVLVPYVTIITHYDKSLGNLSLMYEMLPLAVAYNVASITKIGYRDHDNNGIFVKIRGVGGEDDEGDKHAPIVQAPQVQDLGALSLIDIIGALTLLV